MGHVVQTTYCYYAVLPKVLLTKSCATQDVTAGATGVAPKFSDTLTLFKRGGQILPLHRRGRTQKFPMVTSLSVTVWWSLTEMSPSLCVRMLNNYMNFDFYIMKKF